MIERHYNADYINEICNHPAVIDNVRHRDTVRVDLSRVVEDRSNYVLAVDGGAVLFFADRHEPGCYEGHHQFLPGSRGKFALQTLRGCADWMFTNTDCKRLVGRTPHDNLPALRMNAMVPMRFVRVIPDAWLSAKGLVDLHEYELTRNDWLGWKE